MKIRKGDNVMVLRGRDRGKTGKVLKVDTRGSEIMVQGINLYKKHARPRRQGEKGEVVQITKPLPIASVMLICLNCSKPARTGFRLGEDNKKVRYCKKCKSVT